MKPLSAQDKPELTIDLIGPDGNAYALRASAQTALIAAGQTTQAAELGERFEDRGEQSTTPYEAIRALAETSCTVTWLNEYAQFTRSLHRHPDCR